MTDPHIMLRITCALLGIWGLLNAAQWAADLKSWRVGGAGGWDLQSLRASRVYRSALLAHLFSEAGLKSRIGFLAFSSTALLVVPLSWANLALIGIFWIMTLLLGLRAGADGGDKMALVVASGAFLQCLGLLTDQPTLHLAGVLWTGGQLTIAYATSGLSKLLLAPWRNGEALAKSLSSYMWGHGWLAKVVQRRGIAIILAWGVILPELLFPLALFAPQSVLLAIFGLFFLFHWAIAWAMGINSYPWAFAAAYPSVLMLSLWLGKAIGG